MLTASPAWTAEALCQGLASSRDDPWHPADAESPTLQYAIARRLCLHCPVRLDCLHEGLELLPRVSVQGMWGGLTPAELRELARAKGLPARKEAEHGTRSRYIGHGCRCDPCVRANAAEEHDRRLANDEVASRRRCAAWTVYERPCRGPAVGDSPYCATHDTVDLEAC